MTFHSALWERAGAMNAHQQPVPGEVRQAAITDSAADCARYAATFAQVLRPAELVHLTLHPCLACEYIRPGTGSMPASRAWQHRRKTRALGAVEGGGGCPEIAQTGRASCRERVCQYV